MGRGGIGATGFEPVISRSQSERLTGLGHAPTLNCYSRVLEQGGQIERRGLFVESGAQSRSIALSELPSRCDC